MTVRRVGVLTTGGDCPGLSAFLLGLLRAVDRDRVELVGLVDGYASLMRLAAGAGLADVRCDLDELELRRASRLGGSFLGSSRVSLERPEDLAAASEAIGRSGLDMMVVVGGDGSLLSAAELAASGVPTVAVPKTIDGDVAASDVSLGFSSAVSSAVASVDALRDTAWTHDVACVVETMGRGSGALAFAAAVASSSEAALVPEWRYDPELLLSAVSSRGAVAVVAEAAGAPDAVPGAPGSAASAVSEVLSAAGLPHRTLVLGHLLRGGSPDHVDRALAAGFAAAAAASVHAGSSALVASVAGSVVRLPVSEALRPPRSLSRAEVAGFEQLVCSRLL